MAATRIASVDFGTVTVQGLRIHVRDVGAGQPVLFLHGNPDTGDLWQDVIARLDPQRFRSLAPDLPGFGRSEVSPDFDFSLAGMAAFVDQLVTALAISPPVHLVVHDFGGPFGLAWAVEAPQRVRSITAINTVFSSSYRWHFWARVWRTPGLGELSMLLMRRTLFRRELRRGSRRLSAEHIDRVYAALTPTTRKTVLRLYRQTDPENFAGWEDRLLALARQIPVAVLWGAWDPYLPAELSDRFGAQTVELFKDCGHWLPAEAPAEVAARLLAFWSAQRHPLAQLS